MSSIFVAIQRPSNARAPLQPSQLRPFLPFVPEDQTEWASCDGRTRLFAWSVLSEASRGQFWSLRDDSAFVYDGWVQERPQDRLDCNVATNLRRRFGLSGPPRMNTELAGEWSALTVDANNTLRASSDFAGARHLYYGHKDGIAAVSNRAMVCAAALHGGTLPAMDTQFFAWLMAIVAAPFGSSTPWPGIKLLENGQSLTTRGGEIALYRPMESVPSPSVDWDALHSDFVARCAQIRRYPDLKFRLGLTGGKDSRLVLGGVLAAQAVDKIDFAYLRAPKNHPEVALATDLARRVGIDFRVLPPEAPGDIFEAIDRHNFQTEYGLNAWDLKAVTTRPRHGTLHGNLGELLRGSTKLWFLLSWRLIANHYGSCKFADPLQILTDGARNQTQQAMRRWVQQQREQGLARLKVHDTYHRHGRMQRWVGQAQLSDGCGVMALNPIPSPALFQVFFHLSQRDRVGERIHFELMRRHPADLWRQPFANDRWSALLMPRIRRRPPAFHGPTPPPSPQMRRWHHQRQDIVDYLLARGDSQFFDLVDRRRLIKFIESLPEHPDFFSLRGIFGLLGIRRALETPFTSQPFRMEPAADA